MAPPNNQWSRPGERSVQSCRPGARLVWIITRTPSARSDLPPDRAGAVVNEQIRRYAAEEKMLSVVDLERGY